MEHKTSKGYFQFKLGNFDCIAINDFHGVTMTTTGQNSLSNAPEAERLAILKERGVKDGKWEKDVNVNCLFVDTGTQRILFDVGMGIPDYTPGSGQLRHFLKSAGIQPEDIDTVIFTHGHWDHVVGLADGDDTLLFPNADYMMQRTEWQFWTDRGNMSLMHPNYAAFDPLSFDRLPLISERVQLFEPEGQILPGIRAIAVPGHTPGHTAFSITSDGQELLHISDLIHTDLHFEYPQFHHEVDIQPELSFASRKKVFERAAAENLLVFGCHTPGFASGLGHIVPNNGVWKWVPYSS